MLLGFHPAALPSYHRGKEWGKPFLRVGTSSPAWDRGCTHRLEITVNDFLYVKHLQTLQNREGEAPNYRETEALEAVILHQLVQVDSGTEKVLCSSVMLSLNLEKQSHITWFPSGSTQDSDQEVGLLCPINSIFPLTHGGSRVQLNCAGLSDVPHFLHGKVLESLCYTCMLKS